MIDTNKLRRLRCDRGISQRKLASAAGVDPLTIQRLEAGADPGDLPLRVLQRITDTLGVTPAQLLRKTTEESAYHADPGATARVGAILLGLGSTTITTLEEALDVPQTQVRQAVEQLATRLPAFGIAIARHGDQIWLSPSKEPAPAAANHKPLRLDQARLLRRMQRGENIQTKLGKVDRELVLPHLMRRGLINDTGTRFCMSEDVHLSLTILADQVPVHVLAPRPNVPN